MKQPRLARRGLSLAAGLLVLFVLASALVGCGAKSSKHSVNQGDYLALEDKNGNRIYYGMTREEMGQLFGAAAIDERWEAAHENLSVYFTSWLEYETQTLARMEVDVSADQKTPSWTTPQGVKIGDSKQKVLDAYEKESLPGDVLDMLFAQDTRYSAMMYPITVEELYKLEPDTPVYRLVFAFQEDTLTSMIIGDLASME